MTQWRHGGTSGVPSGLDYATVVAMMEVYGVAQRRSCLDKIRVLEAEALNVMIEEHERSEPVGK